MPFPTWFAATTQLPARRPVTVDPVTEQIVVLNEVNVTGNPELAAALRLPLVPTVTVGAAPNVIVWFPSAIAIACVAWGAAL